MKKEIFEGIVRDWISEYEDDFDILHEKIEGYRFNDVLKQFKDKKVRIIIEEID